MGELNSNTTINERYLLEAEIGQGGVGVVYRAYDMTLKRPVAVKVLTRTQMDAQRHTLLLHEAQMVAALDHPNIITVYDAGKFEDIPFIVMQLIDGQNLLEYQPDDFEVIVNISKQVCAALEHSHEKGIIHRDLKPENIIIDADGNARLMDFGLARSVASRMTSDGVIAGTVFYMAPEQAMGKSFDQRIDLYALGVILYELTTGELPFIADDPVAVISQHLHAPVVPPRARREDIPPGLSDLILQLLAKDPHERPSSASEVLGALNHPLLLNPEAAPKRELFVLDRIVRGRMVGREMQFEEARELWNNAAAGEGQLLLISGEPGIGKTRFTRELTTLAEISGGLNLLGASYAEGGMPYAAFRQVLRAGLHAEAGQAVQVSEDVLKDLLTLVPELRSSFPGLEGDDYQQPLDQQQLFENFTIFLNALGEHIPVLLVLEDVHWADSGTLSLMRHLGRNVRGSRVMVVATYREVELDEARPLYTVLLDLDREKLAHRLKLTRLSQEQSRDMLAAMFADEITPEFLSGIFRETEGNPFFIEEVCKALVEDGRVVYLDGVWDRPSMEEIGIPQSVRVAIQSRVGQLEEGPQMVLRQAAVIGRGFSYHVLRAATELDENVLLEALEDAERAQLIEDVSERKEVHFQFVHAMISSTLVENMRILERRRLHRRAGLAVETLHPEEFQALANHYLEAGETDKAVEYLIQMGDQARILYANQEAIDSYQQAVDYLREKGYYERAAEILLKLGLTYQYNFQFAESSRAYQEAFVMRERSSRASAQDRLPSAPHAYRLIANEPVTLDPGKSNDRYSYLVISNIFCGLVELDPDANIIPDVAQSWDVLDKGRRYIFYLRNDVYWTDGVQVTARDFEFALKRVLDPKLASPQASWLFIIKNAAAYYAGELAVSDQLGIRAVDDLTLEIVLEKPVGYFLHLISCTSFLPVPRHAVEGYDHWDEGDRIITNGPFQLASRERGKSILLEKNHAYHGRYPGNLEKVEFIHYQAEDDPLRMYAESQLEHLWLGFLSSDQQVRARQRYAGEYISFTFMQTAFVGFDVYRPPFDDLRVRRAFTLATDREVLSGSILRGDAYPATGGVIPPGMPGHNPGIGLPYAPEQARHLLADAGYPGGQGFPKLEALSVDRPLSNLVSGYLNAQWLEILGIEVVWQKLEWADLLDRLRERKPNLWGMAWMADYPDPHNFLVEGIMQQCSVQGKLWMSQEFLRIVETAGEVMAQQERIDLYQQADKILVEESPILPLHHLRGHFLVKPWVTRFPTSGFSGLQFKNISVESH